MFPACRQAGNLHEAFSPDSYRDTKFGGRPRSFLQCCNNGSTKGVAALKIFLKIFTNCFLGTKLRQE